MGAGKLRKSGLRSDKQFYSNVVGVDAENGKVSAIEKKHESEKATNCFNLE